MKILLRVIACLIGLSVPLTALLIWQLAFRSGLGSLFRFSPIGFMTIVGWLAVLTVGPFAAVQLWRLRRSGLFAASVLSGFVLVYYLSGLLFTRTALPARSILAAVIVNGSLLGLLLSPAARRIVS
jgi:hypothetical protein